MTPIQPPLNTAASEYGTAVRLTQRFFAAAVRPIVDKYGAVTDKPWVIRNLANIFSTSRLVLSILGAYLLYAHPGYAWRIPLAVLEVTLGFSDGFDGALARGLGTQSTYGAAVDALADKAMVLSLGFFLLLHLEQEASPGAALTAFRILVFVVVFTEIATMIVGAMVGRRKLAAGDRPTSDELGKIKYVVQCFAVAFCWMAAPTNLAVVVGDITLTIAVVLTILALSAYIKQLPHYPR